MTHAIRALLLATLLVAVVGTAPAPASADSKATYYLSLGDSIAFSAQPIGGQQHGYTDAVYKAVRAENEQLQHVKLGCGGETTASVIDTTLAGFCSYEPANQLDVALDFLAAHPGQVELVTITIGGNDALACLDPAAGLLDQACLDQTFPSALANLTTIVHALRAAAHGVPIVGTDYANAFLGQWALFGPEGQALALHNAPIVAALNADLVATYQAAGASVGDVSGAFDSDNFADQVTTKQWGTIPVNVANVCQWTWFCDDKYTLDVHPNTEGYRVIADAVLDALPQ